MILRENYIRNFWIVGEAGTLFCVVEPPRFEFFSIYRLKVVRVSSPHATSALLCRPSTTNCASCDCILSHDATRGL